MKKLITALALSLAVSPVVVADDAPMVVSIKRLSMETADKMAEAAIEACRKEGINVGVTVVDRDGIPQVMLRDTLAAHLTIEISKRKAYTAANFNATTSSLEDRADTAVGRFDDLVMSAGAVPINVGGFIYGGIGVSGAPSGETDEMCAQAGLDAVVEDLEML
ncbi:MAG: heme-binding protein [Gammaproteobacteria bacterium]